MDQLWRIINGKWKWRISSHFSDISGLLVNWEVKNASILNTPNIDRKLVVFGRNNESIQIVEY